jgi:hypothetical protein
MVKAGRRWGAAPFEENPPSNGDAPQLRCGLSADFEIGDAAGIVHCSMGGVPSWFPNCATGDAPQNQINKYNR